MKNGVLASLSPPYKKTWMPGTRPGMTVFMELQNSQRKAVHSLAHLD